MERYSELYRQWKFKPSTVIFPGGEAHAQVNERIKDFTSAILTVHSDPEEVIMVVSHGGVIPIIFSIILNWNLDQISPALWIANCGLTTIEWRPFWGHKIPHPRLMALNDICHLKNLNSEL